MVGLNFQVFFYLIQIIIMLLFFLKIGYTLIKEMIYLSILEESRTDLIKYVTALPVDTLNKAIDSNSWTVLQVLEHLALAEDEIVSTLKEAVLKREYVEDVSQKPIHLTTDRSQKFEAVQPMQPKKDVYTLEEVLNHLTESRESLNKILAHTSEEDLEHIVAENSVFGSLSLTQWLDFIGYHEQRHLAQIKEIVTSNP